MYRVTKTVRKYPTRKGSGLKCRPLVMKNFGEKKISVILLHFDTFNPSFYTKKSTYTDKILTPVITIYKGVIFSLYKNNMCKLFASFPL